MRGPRTSAPNVGSGSINVDVRGTVLGRPELGHEHRLEAFFLLNGKDTRRSALSAA